MESSTGFATFDQAADAVVRWLERESRDHGWLLVRRQDTEWHVLAAADPVCDLRPGHALVWNTPIHDALIACTGPTGIQPAAPVAGRVVRPRRRPLMAGELIVSPLIVGGGRFAGALIGVGRRPAADADMPERERLSLLSGLLGSLVRCEVESAEAARRSERFRYEAMTDALTHLPDRSAWMKKLAAERRRARRLGEMSFVTVIAVDPNGATEPGGDDGNGLDATLRQAALTLRYAVREQDFVARIGEREFAVLGLQCGAIEEHDISTRVHEALHRAGVRAAVGTAASDPVHGHDEIWNRARQAMQFGAADRDHHVTS